MSVEYSMRISRRTVDKLGVKLYDKVSAVIAELIANACDATATSDSPMSTEGWNGTVRRRRSRAVVPRSALRSGGAGSPDRARRPPLLATGLAVAPLSVVRARPPGSYRR